MARVGRKNVGVSGESVSWNAAFGAGNGRERREGVFISRLAAGGVAELNGLLRVGDEILSVNTVDVAGRRLDDVVISMSVSRRLLLTVRPAPTISSETNSSSSRQPPRDRVVLQRTAWLDTGNQLVVQSVRTRCHNGRR